MLLRAYHVFSGKSRTFYYFFWDAAVAHNGSCHPFGDGPDKLPRYFWMIVASIFNSSGYFFAKLFGCHVDCYEVVLPVFCVGSFIQSQDEYIVTKYQSHDGLVRGLCFRQCIIRLAVCQEVLYKLNVNVKFIPHLVNNHLFS